MRKTTLTTLALLAGTSLFAACTTETKTADPATSDGGTANDGGGDAGPACDGTKGNGIIDITITGLPEGVKVDPSGQIVHFKSPTQDVGAAVTAQLASPAGEFTASAEVQYLSDPIVRTAYAATIVPSSFCLGDGQTQKVVVTYAPIPSSNKLWMTNNAPAGAVLGFTSSTLATTSTQSASVALKSPSGRSIAFDADGNMWTLQGTVTDAPIQRYAASSLGASGDKTPDRTLTLDAGCAPGLTQIAFSPKGELYVSSACGQKISRLAPTDIASTGSPTPNLTLGGLGAPEGMAFDRDGNLWVADSGAKTLLRYDAARLATASTDPANLVITPQTPSSGDLAPNHLAFDGAGNLWASSFGGNIIYKLTSSDLSGTGPKTLTPAVQITLPVDELLEGLAFDESGSLWFPLSTGKIGHLTAAQRAASGAQTPQVIITSADVGNAVSFAFYPPATSSPIFGH